jgi:hypothetical protein
MEATREVSRPTDYWRARFWRKADWELEAEQEHAFRLEVEAEPDGTAALLWRYYSLQIELELCQRAQRAYTRTKAPFDVDKLLDSVRDRSDILSVIGSRYPGHVGRANSWAHGRVSIRCPFHDDSSPSMTVYVDQGKWWCHACTFGGDAIDFIQRADGLGFTHAVLKLANEFGVAIPKRGPMGIEVPNL